MGIMEYKEGDDQDPREKAIEEKREKVAKNELQRLRNIARAKKTKVPGVGLTPMVPTESQRSDDLKKASALAKTSTASLGKFQEKLPSALAKKVKTPQGKKRKFDPLVNNDEKAKSLKVLEQLNSKKAPKKVVKKERKNLTVVHLVVKVVKKEENPVESQVLNQAVNQVVNRVVNQVVLNSVARLVVKKVERPNKVEVVV